MANETVDIVKHSTSTSAGPKADHFLVPQLVSFGVIIPITVLGNLFICWIELKRKSRKSSGYFIINLAVSDLAVGFVSIPLDIAEQLSNGWPFFPFMCKVVYPLQTVLMAVSVITLLCMSVERYRAVVTPFKPKPSGRFIVRVIASVWTMSILLVTPYTLVLRMKDGNCVEDWPSQNHVKIYTASVFSLLYLLPLTLITICYTKIGLYLHKEAKRWKSMAKYYGNSVRQGRRISNARHRQNIKIVKAFVAAVMAFAICQLPTHVIWLWHDFGTGSKWKYLYDVLPFCHILTYLNSAIDPFIFGSLNARIFRKKVRSMLSGSKGKKLCRENGESGKAILRQEEENARKNSRAIRKKCLLVRDKRRRTSTMESNV
ncbi:neuropeptide FF receptor 2-like [Oculina patagonica]